MRQQTVILFINLSIKLTISGFVLLNNSSVCHKQRKQKRLLPTHQNQKLLVSKGKDQRETKIEETETKDNQQQVVGYFFHT